MAMITKIAMTAYRKSRLSFALDFLSTRSKNKQMEILLAARLSMSSGVAFQFHFKASLS